MAIAKVAVDKYLNRQLETLTWFKDLRPLEVEEELSYIRPKHKFHVPLRLDQKILFLVGLAYPEVLFRSDLGLGKTALSLELLSYFYKHGLIRRAFVFAPTNEVAEGWEDEIKLWGFNIPYIRLSERLSRDKWDTLQSFKSGLIIGTYAGIAAMTSKLLPVLDETGKAPLDKNGKPINKRKRVVVDKLILKLTKNVDAVVYDQSTKLGSTSSLTFEVCKEFSLEAKYKYGLAGRAFGRDPFIIWSQLFVVDGGKALGRSAGMFREAFWRRKQTSWGTEWLIRKRRQKLLGDFIAASSIGYTVDECIELPPKIPVIKECTFPDENWAYYDRICEELIAVKGNWHEVKNTFLRLRQISSGFVGFKDDDTGEKAQIEFQHNPKLDLLMELLEEVPEDRKVVIVHEFTWSGARICQELTKRKIKHGWLWGGTKNWTPIKEAYNNDPEFRHLVINHAKGAMGLNLQRGNFMFIFESPVSAINRYELEGRIYRNGQKHKSFIYDVMTKDSADQKILEFHKEGGDLYKALVENPEKLLRRKKR